MDILGFINTQEPVASWTAQKKSDFLESFAKACGWYDGCGQTQKAVGNIYLRNRIKNMVNNYRQRIAEQDAIDNATWETITLEG